MKVFLSKGMTWYINERSAKNLRLWINDVIDHEMDLFIVLDGEEGSGKSFALRGLGCFIQTLFYERGIEINFGPENIHFRQKEYFDASKNAKPYYKDLKDFVAHGNKASDYIKNKDATFEILALDEGRGSLGREKDKKTKEVVNWVSKCRYKRQIHIICVPAYHDLHPYIGQWRTKAVVHFFSDYYKVKDGWKLRRGGHRFIIDVEGLRFHHRFRDYKYPDHTDNITNWCAIEVFSPKELAHYHAKKHYYTVHSEDEEVSEFVFSENEES